VRNAFEHRKLVVENSELRRRLAEQAADTEILGSAPGIQRVLETITSVADADANVLILGESGTGKELIANALHERSSRRDGPFVKINCAALPKDLIESELFGHTKGSFTGATTEKVGLLEEAHKGSLLLDEITEMPVDLQAKLLRVLEDRTYRRLGCVVERYVDCRVIAGTNTSLELAVAAGRFREDLYYRLAVFRIPLPGLRHRAEDIVPIAEHFLHEIAARAGVPPKIIHPAAAELLRKHTWPGNAREVRNVVERACILAHGSTILPEHLKLQHRELVAFVDAEAIAGMITIPLRGKTLEEVEREAIRHTMFATAGNVSAAARMLGISRPTLTRRLREIGISRRSLLASS
jgi:DNA-binding NtrC family response regulator